MNAKEAVACLLNHQDLPYIPLGAYAIDCDTAEKVLGHKTYVRDEVAQSLWRSKPGMQAS